MKSVIILALIVCTAYGYYITRWNMLLSSSGMILHQFAGIIKHIYTSTNYIFIDDGHAIYYYRGFQSSLKQVLTPSYSELYQPYGVDTMFFAATTNNHYFVGYNSTLPSRDLAFISISTDKQITSFTCNHNSCIYTYSNYIVKIVPQTYDTLYHVDITPVFSGVISQYFIILDSLNNLYRFNDSIKLEYIANITNNPHTIIQTQSGDLIACGDDISVWNGVIFTQVYPEACKRLIFETDTYYSLTHSQIIIRSKDGKIWSPESNRSGITDITTELPSDMLRYHSF